MSRVILHCDMNNFYASVECMLHPEFRGMPLAVCGDSEERHGIVLAKNYLAKACGIKTGDVIWEAKQKCKDLITVKPHFDEYMKMSALAREIYGKYTSLVEPFGLDECWLDITGSVKDLNEGVVIANKIRERIKNELGVTVSVGVSFNKVFAKLGSDLKKPDAVTLIPKDNFLSLIGDLPASDMIGIGRATKERLSTYCVETINDLAVFSRSLLNNLFGKCGDVLWKNANGLDDSPVLSRAVEVLDKSVGNGITAPYDLETSEEVWKLMLELSQEIGHRLNVFGKSAGTVAIYIKDNDLNVRQWQCALPEETQNAYVIAKVAFELFNKHYSWEKPVRAVTVRAIGLSSGEAPSQLNIFSTVKQETVADARLENTVEDIRGRFGDTSIKNAVVLGKSLKKPPRGVLPK